MTTGRTSTGTSIRQRTGHGIRALVLCALITACGSDESGTLVMRFEHRMEDQALALGTPYTTRYGQTLTFEHLRYWVSNVSLRRGDEQYDVPSSYYLIEQTPEQTRLTVEIKGIPAGSYDELVFHLGVDPAPNGSLDLMAGELTPGVGMDWSWDTGYKFLRTEGRFEERGVAGRFVIHTGNDVLYKRLTGHFAAPVEIITGARTTVRLQAAVERLFAGIELGKTAEILGGTVDSLAGKVAGSYARMFTMITAAGSVRMTGSSPNLGGNTDSGDIPSDGTPPALSAAIIDLPGTQATTALWCDPVPARPAAGERACVTPFLLGTGGAYQDAGLFTFVTDNDAPVRAAAPGIVAEVLFLDHSAITHSDLFLVVIRDSDDAAFRTEYHNLKNLEVERGDEVEAGQVLGGAGDHFDPAVGIVSFGVARHQEVIQRLCPTHYATPELTAAYDGALATSNAAWPGIVHDGLCQAPALVCSGAGACTAPGDYTVAQGDIDAGRRLYRGSCASCHGDDGEGNIGPPLCFGPGCTCRDCVDHATLAARIEADMPPEGYCNPECAANVAAFIVHEFALR